MVYFAIACAVWVIIGFIGATYQGEGTNVCMLIFWCTVPLLALIADVCNFWS